MIERMAMTVLAVAMAIFIAPLFFDLALCIVGNAFPARRPRGTRASATGAAREIRLAVVVPAHEEELLIGRTVASLRAACAGVPGAGVLDAASEIWVVAHNCTDGTARAAAAAGARVLELNDRKLRGKSSALRHGFKAALAAGANALMVVDADSIVSRNLMAATIAKLEQGAEATQCRYEQAPQPGAARPALTRLKALAFRGMNVLRARGRAGLGFSTGLFGNGFALTADVLKRVPFNANSIAEDVEYHTRLVAGGVTVYWIGEAYVHASSPATGKAQAAQEARWEGGRLHVASRATSKLVLALRHGRWRAVETLADVWSLPLSRGIAALVLTLFVASHWLHVLALICALVALVYVIEAAILGDEPMQDLLVLAAAPIYVLWKALITPLVLRQSRSRAEWARTEREAHTR